MPPPVPKKPPIECPDCDGLMYLRLKPPGWKGNQNPFVYRCGRRGCYGLVSAHPDGEPMGTPADARTRKARRHTHAMLDLLWQRAPEYYKIRERGAARQKAIAIIRRSARNRVYAWLADRMGLTPDECHIGSFNYEQCQRAQQFCEGASYPLIRAWHQQYRENGQ